MFFFGLSNADQQWFQKLTILPKTSVRRFRIVTKVTSAEQWSMLILHQTR